ncbi:MAG: M24 family metallopeptidase [Anaerolineae bacterium]
MYANRLNSLAEQTSAHGLDALALVPGPNLFYITGLSFHLSERPVVALFPVDRPPAIVLPALEAVKVEQTTIALEPFPYSDEEGHTGAFQRACVALELADSIIGVEALQMRLLEVRLLERYAPGCRLTPAEEALAEMRMRKDEHEIEQMRRAVAVTEAALRTTTRQMKAGMTEREVAALLTIEMLRAGGEGMSFPPIIVAGPNAASPHATPSDRPIQPGETIIVDCGATVGGYAADITRTFAIGALEPELARVYEVVQAANEAGRVAAGPGVPAEEVDQAARAVIEEAGYGKYFIHRTGHGLGLETHEPPYIVAGNQRPLEPGMTFTVEPGIYLPGRGGVRIEDDVLVTPSGAESLTTFPREFVAL